MSKLKRSATISIHTGLGRLLKDYCSKLEPKERSKYVGAIIMLLLTTIYFGRVVTGHWIGLQLFSLIMFVRTYFGRRGLEIRQEAELDECSEHEQ